MRHTALGRHMAAIAVFTAACGAPAAPSPQPRPQGGSSQPVGGPYDLTVEVFETTPSGQQPVSFPRGIFHFHRPGDTYTTSNGFIGDAEGRHVFPHVAHGTDVTIRADKSWYHQPCSTRAQVVSASTLRLELVKRGSRPGILASPVLSGVVYATTPQGRQPVSGLAIGYIASCRGVTETYMWTDDTGRYEFCRLPPGPGCIDMYWGFESEFGKQLPVNITGDLVVDIDIGK